MHGAMNLGLSDQSIEIHLAVSGESLAYPLSLASIPHPRASVPRLLYLESPFLSD